MKNIKKTDLSIIACLRKDARQRLTYISRTTGVPVSTIYDRMKQHDNGLIVKHTALIDFHKLGFCTRAYIAIKVDRERRDSVKELLLNHPYVNSLNKINNGYDFIIEAVFANLSDLEKFMDSMEQSIVQKQVYYVIDELSREAFLADPKKLCLIKEFENY